MICDKYDINYTGNEVDGYVGLWCAPGFPAYREASVPGSGDQAIARDTEAEAKADAGAALTRWLNEQQVRIDEEFNMTQAGVAIGNAEAFVKQLKAAAQPGGITELSTEEYDRCIGKV